MTTYLVAINNDDGDGEGIVLYYWNWFGGIMNDQYHQPILNEDVINEIAEQEGINRKDLFISVEDEWIEFFDDGQIGANYCDDLIDIIQKYSDNIRSILEEANVNFKDVYADEYIDPEPPMVAYIYECDDNQAEELNSKFEALRKSYLQEVEDLGSIELRDRKYNLKIGGAKIDVSKINIIYGVEINEN